MEAMAKFLANSKRLTYFNIRHSHLLNIDFSQNMDEIIIKNFKTDPEQIVTMERTSFQEIQIDGAKYVKT